MVPSTPTITGDSIEFTLNEQLQGGAIWVRLRLEDDDLYPITQTEFPTDTENSNRLNWVESENAFISYEDGAPLYRFEQVDGNTYRFTLVRGYSLPMIIDIFAYVKDGQVRWINPEANLRATYEVIVEGGSFNQNDNSIDIFNVAQPFAKTDLAVIHLWYGNEEIDVQPNDLSEDDARIVSLVSEITKRGKGVVVSAGFESLSSDSGRLTLTYNNRDLVDFYFYNS